MSKITTNELIEFIDENLDNGVEIHLVIRDRLKELADEIEGLKSYGGLGTPDVIVHDMMNLPDGGRIGKVREWPQDYSVDAINDILRLEGQLKTAEEALGKYADRAEWVKANDYIDDFRDWFCHDGDGYEIAEEALAKIGDKE